METLTKINAPKATNGTVEGTARPSAQRLRLSGSPYDIAEGSCHVNAVAAFGHEVRMSIDEADALNDAYTADVFTEVSRVDKWPWFVEAHAQAAK